VGLGGSLSGIKWDYAGQKSAASRLIPDIPAYSRIMSLKKKLMAEMTLALTLSLSPSNGVNGQVEIHDF
jgi:hypothetical protein